MAASQQAHIDQLVQQNRTLQHGVKKLHEELAAEQKRGQQVVQKIQEQWHVERLQWQEGCDTLQACHKLEYLRLTMDLEKEQDNVLKERNRTRLEKVARLQRDFKITMFQARENELERQVEDLTLELQSLTASKENEMAEKESSRAAALKKVKAEYAEYVAQAEADAAGYAEIEAEKDRLQVSPAILVIRNEGLIISGRVGKVARGARASQGFIRFIINSTGTRYPTTRRVPVDYRRFATEER